MLLDVSAGKDFARVGAEAAEREEAGYDGLWFGETAHEPFLQCLQACQVTRSVTIGTSIAIAFARTPMTLAYTGYDLARYSEGRFVLGLGSQVKPHIERRFSMPWSQPAARMRELVSAMKAIWASWQDGSKLDFRGEFYTHTLMSPFFSPEPHVHGSPPVYLAGVGDLMTEVAGEVADGFFMHPFTTRRYLDEVTLPALRRGRQKVGLTLEGFTVCGPSFVTVGRNQAELDAAAIGTKKQIAFYASTPAYRGVLELHGWGALQPELTRLSKAGAWDEMGSLITDEMLETFSVVGTPSEVGARLKSKLDGVSQRISCYATYDVDALIWEDVAEAVRR